MERERPAAAGVVRVAERRMAKGKLFNLDTLNFGFIRPQSSDDWAMAYCQAELYVEYMLDVASLAERPGTGERGGEQSLRDLLAAYADGLSTADAIRRVFGVSQAEFERGYSAFLKQEAAKMKTLRWPSESEPGKAPQGGRQQPRGRGRCGKAGPSGRDRRRRPRLSADSGPVGHGAEGLCGRGKLAAEAIQIDVRDAEMHRILAESLARRHNDPEAAFEFQAMLELKPDDAEAKAALQKLKKSP